LTVPAIRKAALVLDALASSSEPLTFGQLALVVDLPRSSLHNICTTLVDTGFIDRNSDGRYEVGLRIVELARVRLANTDLVGSFMNVCRESSSLNETTVLSVLSGADVVYVAFINADHPLAVRYQIGMRLQACFTASGKAILATLPENRVRHLVGDSVESRLNPATRKSVSQLLEELALARERGFSVDDEETARGMACIGAPIFEGDEKEACGAIAISMVKALSKPFEPELMLEIQRLANMISRRLGAPESWGYPSVMADRLSS
jgi:DNA-binding IclR family transcriptional regulator